ncbi:MAG: DNA-processing protein DprA [Ichthyobacteriaceae bacterium]|nr:DNA-processing protein DprA [Ichthyobacteriaceae bacterium]
MDDEIFYTVALLKTKGIGIQSAKRMIDAFGGAKKLFEAKKSDIVLKAKIKPYVLNNFNSKESLLFAEKEVDFIRKNNISFHSFNSKSYPTLLKQIYDSPVYIMTKGNVILNTNRVISIVGTRNMTQYGRKFCNELIEEIAQYNPTIISGLAYGIDITAHKAALNNNLATIGVVAHGLNQIYPNSHTSTAKQMMQSGGLLTEFNSDEVPDREHFPQRNRIIAGISKTTIVIEAAKKGGALITAELANDYNRDVFAVPGRSGDLYSEGCNNLIKEHKAILFNKPDDLVKYLGWDTKNSKVIQKSLFVETTKDEDVIMKLLIGAEKSIDDLSILSNMPVYKLSALLINLELKDLVQPLVGKRFQLR